MGYPYVIVKNGQQLNGARKVFVKCRNTRIEFVAFAQATKFSSVESATSWMQRHRDFGTGGLKVIKVEAVS